MRDSLPSPVLSNQAVSPSSASTSRKTNFSPPATCPTCQFFPASTVRTNVPFVPLTHTIFSSTAQSPRNPASVSTFCTCHSALGTTNAKPSQHHTINPVSFIILHLSRNLPPRQTDNPACVFRKRVKGPHRAQPHRVTQASNAPIPS